MANKNLGGKPKKQIDQKLFENLCGIQCTKMEMCDVLECDEKTLTRWCKEVYNLGFSEIYKKKSASGKVSLRRYQFKAAQAGNTTMLVWLGKQYLGQTDKQEIDNKNTDAFGKLAEVLKESLEKNGT